MASNRGFVLLFQLLCRFTRLYILRTNQQRRKLISDGSAKHWIMSHSDYAEVRVRGKTAVMANKPSNGTNSVFQLVFQLSGNKVCSSDSLLLSSFPSEAVLKEKPSKNLLRTTCSAANSRNTQLEGSHWAFSSFLSLEETKSRAERQNIKCPHWGSEQTAIPTPLHGSEHVLVIIQQVWFSFFTSKY